ncbi:MAG: thioredoxin domain-containing protein [Gammaproteobacteria bacterium]|nr:thioredoxin domain-containing protein [Gammaproteobacteria bacterium]
MVLSRRIAPLLGLGLIIFSQTAMVLAKPNALYHHPSPYLAMHGEDPVQWHEWNAQTLGLARAQRKLLFVSSGYFACHWCHVMQRESYRNSAIAAYLNAHFIAVKVDREINTALDTHLIEFVEHTQGFAGWPLNVFITPEGYPLAGMVYAPAEQFRAVLEKIATQWQASPQKLSQLARDGVEEMRKASRDEETSSAVASTPALINALLTQSFQLADELQGGFGEDTKFPSVPQLQVLLAVYAQQPQPRLKQFLDQTLGQMARLGLRDQLNGGFFRYVVDPGWHTPHFEKMLYDNAQLATLYLDASELLVEPGYAAIGRDTLDFMLRELHTEEGGFAASLSAVDANGIEGGYYLWQQDELKKLLTPDELAAVQAFWRVEGSPELAAGHHLIQTQSLEQTAKQLAIPAAALTQRIEQARQKMLQARNQRHLPVDKKRLASWNGLALKAFVNGDRVLKQDKYRRAAQDIMQGLRRQWWNTKTRSLYRYVDNKKPLGEGTLEDYAYLAQGVYAYWRTYNSEQDKVVLEELLAQAWQRFHSVKGWQLEQDSLLRFAGEQMQLKDNALPSPSATLIAVSLQYAKSPFVEQAQLAMRQSNLEVESQAFWHATLIGSFLILQAQGGGG